MSFLGNDLFGKDPFGGLFDGLLRPDPPESLPRRLLGINPDATIDAEQIRAAFKAAVKAVHPDVEQYAGESVNPAVRQMATSALMQEAEIQELVWAKDVLIYLYPPPPTDPVTGEVLSLREVSSRNGHPECPGCGVADKEPNKHGYWPLRHFSGRYVRWHVGCADRDRAQERSRRLAEARAETPCQQCGATFNPARSDARYCSPACRQRAYRKRIESEQ